MSEDATPAAATAQPAPQARGLAKQGVSPEVLYERYRGERGMVLKSFLKFFRDAVLYDNSWTWGQAVSVFFDHAVDGESGQQDEERRLSFHMFRSCLRRFIRQSMLVTAEAAKNIVGEADAAQLEYFRWEAFKKIVGDRLFGAPRSDNDEMLNKWFLQEPIQLLCLQNEYHLRRVYRSLVKTKEPSVRGWVDLCKADAPLSLEKTAMVKCLRELIPKDLGALRGEDQSNALRMGNHENTSHEDGAKDAPQASVTFPEFVEMTVRCALGTTPFRSAPGEPDEEEEDEENKNARSFDAANDELPFAQMRIRKIWDWLFEWLATELDKTDHKENDSSLLMEDCPAYDELYSDVHMLFAHYASGEPYSRTLDFTNPDLRLSTTDFLRQCRDSCMLDSRITLTTINAKLTEVAGSDLGTNALLNFFQWQCLLVELARVKYQELRAQDAIRILLRKWLVPMVYVDIPRTELSDLVFMPSIVTLCLTYEQHLAKMLERFTTTKEITIGPDGEPEEEREIEDDFRLKAGRGDASGENAAFLQVTSR